MKKSINTQKSAAKPTTTTVKEEITMNTPAVISSTPATVKQNDNRPRVYICSPFRPISTDPILRANELIDNLKLAKDACTFAALRGCDPVAPHLFYPQFLNDEDEVERALGMELGILCPSIHMYQLLKEVCHDRIAKTTGHRNA